ncbi:hypothetical protein BASA81_008714 [Batrachochytrium salamandrivorans]|nr:hypothetical protein BASA81_008714 [Batrachochytrium salamandrivorans]
MNLAKDRLPLQHAPTESYTVKRSELKQAEDLKLVKHFASWLTKITHGRRQITEEEFENDLLDGVALCEVMQQLEGSGLVKFHQEPKSSFQAKENLQSFQAATKALALPVTFGSEDLEKQNITRIVSTLVFVAHTAHAQGVFVGEMDKEIVDKVVKMDEQLIAISENGSEDATAAAAAAPWWHQILIKLGLGDWIASLNQESVKAYLETLKQNAEIKLEALKQNAEAKLPESIKAKLHPETIQQAE